jgi:hypothetical protein
MILYKSNKITNRKDRPIRNLSLNIEELPQKPTYLLNGDRDRVKFNKTTSITVRRSMEYKEYIRFLKAHLDMNKCTVLKGLVTTHNRKYTIEIHHEPFSLFSIIDTVTRKREALGEPISHLDIADEVMELHYDEKVGLIPLSKTMHELVENDKVIIPLQFIYQKYNDFYDEYEPYMDQKLKDLIEAKVNMSLECDEIQSDVLNPAFVYVEVDGFKFPEVPDEWKDLFNSIKLDE